MPDALLVISCVVAFVVLFLTALYLLVYYSHPDDKNDAYVPKVVVITGFMLAGATVLLFPLDVANNDGYAGE
jgi:LMBR1 domain-containing protein 1